jgi:23S rRNA (guanosine2251-2'-O)-methyltransferase
VGRDRRSAQRFAQSSPDIALLWGYHPVREALRSSHRKIVQLWATAAAAERLAPELRARELTPRIVTPDELAARLPANAVHQGMLLEARHLEAIDISEVPDKGLVLVLDQITDPHNVGAIIRTAAAFNVDTVVTTERHSPELAGVLAKSASGGLEHVAICAVTNLARALTELQDMGYQVVGLDSEGPAPLAQTTLSRPLALVLGAEGKGLRHLTRERCDVLARLDMPGKIKSLNVSNACAVALTLALAQLET